LVESLEDRCVPALTVSPQVAALAPLGPNGLQGRPVIVLAGVPFSGVVATFNASSVADLSSSINWGDGHTSPGTFVPNGSTDYAILGSNTYAQPGFYSIVVNLGSSTGSTQTVTTSALVLPPAGGEGNSVAVYPAEGGGSVVTVSLGGVSLSSSGNADAGWLTLVDYVYQVLQPTPTPRLGSGQPTPSQPQSTPVPVLLGSGVPGSVQLVTVTATEQVPWASLREQQGPPPLARPPTPVQARAVPAAESPAPVTLGNGELHDLSNAPALALVLAVANMVPSWTPPTVLPFQHGPAPAPDALGGLEASCPDSAPAADSDVYRQPVEQVADRSELNGFPVGLPYRLAQEGPTAAVAVAPLLPAEPGRRVEDAADSAQAPGRTTERQTGKEGTPRTWPVRPWFLAATACVLQAVHLVLFRPNREPAPALGTNPPRTAPRR
jgi:hypothetical protein